MGGRDEDGPHGRPGRPSCPQRGELHLGAERETDSVLDEDNDEQRRQMTLMSTGVTANGPLKL